MRSLWQHPDFLKLWAGQTISELGSHISREGLPLLAILTLNAGPVELGLLSAAAAAPVIIISLVAGVWVDRLPRRPLMMWVDLARAALLATIPIAAALGRLSMMQVYGVAALVGVLTVFFSVAYRAYLPTLVERAHLTEGNSKLALTDATTEVIGPGLAGVLVQTISAPFAILFDALSFLASAGSLAIIRKPEAPPTAARETLWVEARTGLHSVWADRRLRALALKAATSSFFGSFIGVLYGLYALRELGLTPAFLGLTIGVGGLGSLAGALLAERMALRWGTGRVLITTAVLSAFFTFLLPVAAWAGPLAWLLLVVGQAGDVTGTVYAIHEMSLRQNITPDRLLGRVNASMELLAAGIGPLGALVGGALGQTLGIQPTLLIAAVGILLSTLWLAASPIPQIRETSSTQTTLQ